MIRNFCKIHQLKAQFFRRLFQPNRVFFRTEIIVDGISKRRLKTGCHNGFHGLQRQFNRILYGSNDMNTLHWIYN